MGESEQILLFIPGNKICRFFLDQGKICNWHLVFSPFWEPGKFAKKGKDIASFSLSLHFSGPWYRINICFWHSQNAGVGRSSMKERENLLGLNECSISVVYLRRKKRRREVHVWEEGSVSILPSYSSISGYDIESILPLSPRRKQVQYLLVQIYESLPSVRRV